MMMPTATATAIAIATAIATTPCSSPTSLAAAAAAAAAAAVSAAGCCVCVMDLQQLRVKGEQRCPMGHSDQRHRAIMESLVERHLQRWL